LIIMNHPLSTFHRYLGDLAEQAQRIPRSTVLRTMQLCPTAMARALAEPRPGWTALFTKALAFVAARQPELRQSWQTWPRTHLYEHPVSVAAVAVERWFDEELPGLWARLVAPEKLGLPQIDGQLERFRDGPAERLGQVRRCLKRCRRPAWLRGAGWWLDTQPSGQRRARRVGTFAVASVGSLGANIGDALYPAPVVLTFGPIDERGTGDAYLTFDARLLTCATAARVLGDLELALTCEIVMELRYLRKLDAA
jgi:hypothetical protein